MYLHALQESRDAGEHIGAAFWNPGPHNRPDEMLVVSHRGLQKISSVRTIPERLNGLERFLSKPSEKPGQDSLALLSVADAREIEEFVKSAQSGRSGVPFLQYLSISEAVRALNYQPIFEAWLAQRFLKWYCRMRTLPGSSSRQGGKGGHGGTSQEELADAILQNILNSSEKGQMKLSVLSSKFQQQNANLKRESFGNMKGKGNALVTAKRWLKKRQKYLCRGDWQQPDPLISLKKGGGAANSTPDSALLKCVKVEVISGTADKSFNLECNLASFETFPSKESLQGIAAPDGTLPLCISKYLSPSEMQHQLGLKPLSFELWFEHFKLNYEEQDLLYA